MSGFLFYRQRYEGGRAPTMTTDTTERPQGFEEAPGVEPAKTVPAAPPAEPEETKPALEPEPDWKAELERERAARQKAEERLTQLDREKRGLDRRISKLTEEVHSGNANQAVLDELAIARAEIKDFQDQSASGTPTNSAATQAQAKIAERQAKEREATQKTAWDANVARAQMEAQRELEARGYKETDPELADAVEAWKTGDVWGAVDLLRTLPKKETNPMPAPTSKVLSDKELDAIREAARKEGYEKAKREVIAGGAAETTPGTAGGGRDTNLRRRLETMNPDEVAKLSQDQIQELYRAIKQER